MLGWPNYRILKLCTPFQNFPNFSKKAKFWASFFKNFYFSLFLPIRMRKHQKFHQFLRKMLKLCFFEKIFNLTNQHNFFWNFDKNCDSIRLFWRIFNIFCIFYVTNDTGEEIAFLKISNFCLIKAKIRKIKRRGG